MKRTFDQVSLCLLKQGNKQALKVFWERLRRRLPSLKTRPPRQAGQHPRIDSDDDARDLRTRFVVKHLGCQARLIRILPWRVIQSRIGVQKNYSTSTSFNLTSVCVCVRARALSFLSWSVPLTDCHPCSKKYFREESRQEIIKRNDTTEWRIFYTADWMILYTTELKLERHDEGWRNRGFPLNAQNEFLEPACMPETKFLCLATTHPYFLL